MVYSRLGYKTRRPLHRAIRRAVADRHRVDSDRIDAGRYCPPRDIDVWWAPAEWWRHRHLRHPRPDG